MSTLLICLIVAPVCFMIGVKLADWIYDLTH